MSNNVALLDVDPGTQTLFNIRGELANQARLLEGLEALLEALVQHIADLVAYHETTVVDDSTTEIVTHVDTTAIAESLAPILKQLDLSEKFDALNRNILEILKKPQQAPVTSIPRFNTSGLAQESTLTAVSNPLAAYQANDLDEAADPAYYGFENADGKWIIKRLSDSAGTIRYAKGDSDYSTAWTGRAGQSYATFGSVF